MSERRWGFANLCSRFRVILVRDQRERQLFVCDRTLGMIEDRVGSPKMQERLARSLQLKSMLLPLILASV